jgi:hypothetical protein
MKTPRWFNRNRVLSAARIIAALVLILAAAAMAFLAISPRAVAQPTAAPAPPPANQQLSPEEARLRKEWQEAIRKVPLPKKGCFRASYPEKKWKEVPCGPPSQYPFSPARGLRPNTVGNGNDVSARVTGLISSAVGSFDSVTPADVTETGTVQGGNTQVPNAFSLQINPQPFSNTQFFGNKVCNPFAFTNCAFQQFIFSQNSACNGPCVFMEYWLLGFGPTCPSGSWVSDGNGNCVFNSASMPAPAVTAAQLRDTTLTGTATGTTDSVVLTTAGGTATAMAADSVVNLSQSWNTAEWIVCGDCCGSQANFSTGTSIVSRIRVSYGGTAPPTCFPGGFTGETNNLTFGPTAPKASQPGPALIFTESSAGGMMAACAYATSVGEIIVDTTPPVISSVSASPNVLWPPNHKMAPVAVAVSASDVSSPPVTCEITSVTSNEPLIGPGSHTAPDWQITGDLSVNLRAERSGAGNGRVYTLAVQCTDASNNNSSARTTVSVPHKR